MNTAALKTVAGAPGSKQGSPWNHGGRAKTGVPAPGWRPGDARADIPPA
nr:hypothetical protein [uncultured Methanoregula sp.]